MTPAQTAATQQVRQILTENFDVWVFTARATDENNDHRVSTFYHGPLDSRVGLARITAVRFDQQVIDLSGEAEAFTKE